MHLFCYIMLKRVTHLFENHCFWGFASMNTKLSHRENEFPPDRSSNNDSNIHGLYL